MLDIDDFKTVNDTMGHAIGDLALITLVKLLKEHFRRNDIIGRLGGDEFIEILPATSHESAKLIAEQIREAVWEQPFLWEAHTIRMSVSIGVASLAEDDTNWLDWMKRADNNLYLAKSSGRNKVV